MLKRLLKKMNIFLLALVCMLSAISIYADDLGNNTNDKQLTVDVFTLTKWSLPDKQHLSSMTTLQDDAVVNIYQIDKIFQLNDQLNRVGIHSFKVEGKEVAITTAKAWIEGHKVAYQQVIEGLNKSLQLNIQQVPAIIFDNQYIVLGTLDLNRAYESYLDLQRKISVTEEVEKKAESKRPA